MSEDRPGQGYVSSSAAAKEGLGRTTFQRPTKDHLGHRSNPTEWAASSRLEKGRTEPSQPTPTETSMAFKANPSEVRIFRAAGMSDADIYDALKNK